MQDSDQGDATVLGRAHKIVKNIRAHGLSIYHEIDIGDPDLWLPTMELEAILNDTLPGLSVAFPARTRSGICQDVWYR